MPPGLGKTIGDPDNDDYVAQVLAKEARDSSVKYSALGMEAYMPARPTSSAPKPNTRFLRHIIKETDNHNAALKRKEEREARERMRELRNQTASSAQASGGDRRRRSRRSDDQYSRRDRGREDREDRHRSDRRRRRSRSTSLDRKRPHTSRREREVRGRDDDRHRSSRNSRRHRSYSRSRSRSPRRKDSDSFDRRRRHRRRSTSRYRSPGSREDRKDRDSSGRHQRSAAGSLDRTSGNESDPLEELVGPLPKEEAPIRSRGRGAYKPNNSSIDAHFAPDYNPSLDVQPEDDEGQTSRSSRRPVAGLMTGDDDWELALEALRDRARWKQTGEDRLREAGFNDDIVDRWKSNTTPAATGNDEGLVENVKWSTKDEGREWDRGKFVNDDGHISVKASW
ncbi:uncharacterized protein DSM5745_02863 [Aspergillus mulundensis]|uniref:Pre-mRNA-splicing factor 38B n=1 Tax=Aspergillus mulundensis TaxID=1810919 RepID=A0A3D8SJ71_9EURO|nr:Uncharacterized protein DSM5745_02863 [Aspergillus mulundensis]RDW86221.1 Uncharacterized protein DSM5745_02863 [Aspergillus mulundensis]